MPTIHLKYPSAEMLKAGLSAEAKYLPQGLLKHEESQLKYGLLQKTDSYYRNSCETQIFTERDILSMLSIQADHKTSIINLSSHDMPTSFQVLESNLEKGNVKYSLESLNIENISTNDSAGVGNRIFLMLDGSWSNLKKEELPDKLEVLHHNMKADDRFLVTVDQIKDPKIILEAYTSKPAQTYYKSIINSLNIAYFGNADDQKFEYYPSYNPHTGLVSHFLISKAAQRVKLEKMNFTVNLARWETILIAQEQKYSHAMLNQVVASAGFSILDYVADEKGYLAAYVIEKANW